MTVETSSQKPSSARAAVLALKGAALEPLQWEIEVLKAIPDTKDRYSALKERKIPQAINALLTQAEVEIYVDLIARSVGISVKAVEDLLTNCVDLYSELSTAFGKDIKKAEPRSLAVYIYKWFANNERGRFFKTGDNKAWLFFHGHIYEIGNNSTFNALMDRLTQLAAIEKPGNLVWYYLQTMCLNKGEPIDMVSWLFTDREKDTIFLNLNSPHNKILRVTAGEDPAAIDNGTNEHSVLLSSSLQIRPFEFQSTRGEAEGFRALESLFVNTVPAQKPQRYFLLCWTITTFLMDYQGDRGILQIIGTSGLGKSKVAERISQLIYGENYVGRGSGAGDVRIATQNPVNFQDNLENRNLTQGVVDFLLLLANSSTKTKAKAGSDTEVVYQKLKSMGVVTSIEPFPGKYPELINRTFPITLEHGYRSHGYMHDEVMREILKKRALMLTAVFKMIARVVLPRLSERTDWSKITHTDYPGHNKERMNEHLCMMLMVLEGVLEYIPWKQDVPVKKQASEILERWIGEFEEQATQTAITSNTLLTLIDGLAKEIFIKIRGKGLELTAQQVSKHFGDRLVKVFSDQEYLEDFYLTEPEETVDEDPDGEGFTSYVQRLEFIMTAADLYNVFNRFCATMHTKNPFENPTALAARISNDRAILEKADWEVVYPYKKVQGHNYWRFTKKYKA